MLIGRHADAQVRTDEPTMSTRHAEILDTEHGVRLRDLGSLNGTQVNGTRVFDTMLKVGDRIEIGGTTILIRRPRDDTEPRLTTLESNPSGADDTGQTVRVRLDELRTHRESELDEDPRLLVLRDLFEALRAHDDRDFVLDEVRRVLQSAFVRSRVFILRDDGQGQWHDSASESRPSMSFVIEAARADSAIMSTSLPADARFSASVSVRLSGIQSAIAAPAWCDGTVQAIIYVDRLKAPPFSRRDLHLLGIAANHISAVLENILRIRALQQAREALAELKQSLLQRAFAGEL
jgi:pSer/pThr/pTyr-binding forkhead associated (FHA) protein